MTRPLSEIRADDNRNRLSALDAASRALDDRHHLLATVDALAGCLQELVDLQNGWPLPKYEKQWTETMETACRLLAEMKS